MKKLSVRELIKTLPIIPAKELLYALSDKGKKEYAKIKTKLYIEKILK